MMKTLSYKSCAKYAKMKKNKAIFWQKNGKKKKNGNFEKWQKNPKLQFQATSLNLLTF